MLLHGKLLVLLLRWHQLYALFCKLKARFTTFKVSNFKLEFPFGRVTLALHVSQVKRNVSNPCQGFCNVEGEAPI